MAGLDFLRGLFGSSARQAIAPGGSFIGKVGMSPEMNPAFALGVKEAMGEPGEMKRPPVAVGNPEHSYLGGLIRYQRPEGQTGAERMALLGAAMSDAGAALQGGRGDALARVQDGFRKRAAEAQKQAEMANLKALAGELYGDDPEAQLLFAADPESFVKARAERLKPLTLSGGQTFIDPAMGRRFTAPLYEKFDDRFGGMDPNTGRAFFTEARGPTFQEQTGRQNADETARSNRVNEGLRAEANDTAAFSAQTGRMAHSAREAAGGYGTPGGGGVAGDFGGLTTEQLLQMLRGANGGR